MTKLQLISKATHTIKSQPLWKTLSSLNFNIIVAFLICVVAVLYFIQINSAAAKGFEIKDLEMKIEELKDSNKKLELKTAELKSMTSIKERVGGLNMKTLAAGGIDYIVPGSTAVALK